MWLLLLLVGLFGFARTTSVNEHASHSASQDDGSPCPNPMHDWSIRASNICGTQVINFPFNGNLKNELEHSPLRNEHQVLISFLKDNKPTKFDSLFVPLNNDFDDFFLPVLTISNCMFPMQTYDVGDVLEFSLKARWPDYSKVQFSCINLRVVDLERPSRYSRVIYHREELHFPITHLAVRLTEWVIPKELEYVEKFHVICTYTAICNTDYASKLFEKVSMIDVLMEIGESGDSYSSTTATYSDDDDDNDEHKEIISNLWIGKHAPGTTNPKTTDANTNTPHREFKLLYRTAAGSEPSPVLSEKAKTKVVDQGIQTDKLQEPKEKYEIGASSPTATADAQATTTGQANSKEANFEKKHTGCGKNKLDSSTGFEGIYAENYIKKKSPARRRCMHNNFRVNDASFKIYFNSGILQDIDMQRVK